MKKIILLLSLLAIFSFSCQREEIKQDCVTDAESVNAQIAFIYENAPLTKREVPGMGVVEAKFVVVTPELSELFKQSEKNYKEAIESKGNILSIVPSKYCWWCECSSCGWVGNIYPCAGVWGDPCGGYQCQYCGRYTLITVTISCDLGHCVTGK